MLPGTSADEAKRALERARQAVETARFRGGKEDSPHDPLRGCPAERPAAQMGTVPFSSLNVTMSFGVAELLPNEDEKELIHRADAALYAAKQAGRNRGCWHDGQAIHPIPRPCDEKPAETAPPAAAAPAATQKPASEFGLCSKGDFAVSLGRRLAEWRRRGSAPTLLLMRIDDFPGLGRRYGQAIANIVVRSAVQFLSASIRAMDLGGEYGEATFAMLLPGASSTELIRVAERLRQAVARCVLPIDGHAVQFTVSLAAAVAIQTDTTEQMLSRIEEALDKATASGGNCTFFHNGHAAEPAQATMERIRAAAVV